MDTTMILDSGNTAWIIVATLLVLLMTIPGIALFYGGLVRQKNVLSIIMQSLLIVGAVSILWVAFGYSFVFGSSLMETDSVWRHFIGGFDKLFLQGITTSSLTTRLDSGSFCGTGQVCRFPDVYSALEHPGVHTDGPLGMGRRFSPADGCHRLCRWNRGTHQCRHRSPGHGHTDRETARL